MNDIKKLVQMIPDGVYDAALGIARGGLVPAVYFSNAKEVPLAICSYSSQQGNGDGGNETLEILQSKNRDLKLTDKILVIDDLSDTGFTLREIVDILTARGYTNIDTACIDYRETSVFEPTYYVNELSADAPWVVYDWETIS